MIKTKFENGKVSVVRRLTTGVSCANLQGGANFTVFQDPERLRADESDAAKEFIAIKIKG